MRVDGENLSISSQKSGVAEMFKNIFGDKGPSNITRPVVESIRYLGDFLLGTILNSEGTYEAAVVNMKTSNLICKLELPSISGDFEYEVSQVLTSVAPNRL